MRFDRWLAVVLLAAAGVLGFVGYSLLTESTPTPAQLVNQGRIAVFTSDPKARGTLWVGPAVGSGGRHSTDLSTLDVFFHAESKRRRVWWAVVFSQDAQLPDSFEQSGRVKNVWPQLGRLSVQTDGPVHYITNVAWPGEVRPGNGATVIFGHVPRALGDASGTVISVDITFPVRQPLVADREEFLTLSTPEIGWPLRFGSSTRFDYFQKSGTDPEVVANLKKHSWLLPQKLEVEFLASFKPPFVTQQAGTQPISPFTTEWAHQGTLKVDATFTRPSVASEHERETFFAGVVISLAAGLFVWALELLIGPERVPVIRRLRGNAGNEETVYPD